MECSKGNSYIKSSYNHKVRTHFTFLLATQDLYEASKNGDISQIEECLSRGALMDELQDTGLRWPYEKMTPLMAASYHDKCHAVAALISKGVQMDKENGQNVTALYLACWKGHVDVVKILVNNNADTETSDGHGTSPLMAACRRGSVEIVSLLLSKGANVDKINDKSETALYLASENGHDVVMKILLENQADTEIYNVDGFSALMVACMCPYRPSCVRLLLDYLSIEGTLMAKVLWIMLKKEEFWPSSAIAILMMPVKSAKEMEQSFKL